VTEISIQANWTANGNSAGTQYYCENTTKGTNSGWTTSFYWNSTGLTEGTLYNFRVKARNEDGIETTWTDLGETGGPTVTNLILTPATQAVSIGAQATVNIGIENVTDLMTVEINLTFDPAILQYVLYSADEGSFWEPQGILSLDAEVTAPGNLNIESGTGTILTVAFERIAAGGTNVCFDATELLQPGTLPGAIILHNTGECCSLIECIGDFDGDLQVGIYDLHIFAMAYRCSEGDENWNPLCDLDGDGTIAIYDLHDFAMHYRDDCFV